MSSRLSTASNDMKMGQIYPTINGISSDLFLFGCRLDKVSGGGYRCASADRGVWQRRMEALRIVEAHRADCK